MLNSGINIKQVKNPDDLGKQGVALWYLLFRCEVIKNPAALIHHNMFFDLVKAGELKWTQDNIEDLIKIVPMFEKGMIKSAMNLNAEYSEFMPHKYSYQRKENFNVSSQLLVEREANITKQWLELKLGKVVSNNLVTNCNNDHNNTTKIIWKLILESFGEWGLDATQPIFDHGVKKNIELYVKIIEILDRGEKLALDKQDVAKLEKIYQLKQVLYKSPKLVNAQELEKVNSNLKTISLLDKEHIAGIKLKHQDDYITIHTVKTSTLFPQEIEVLTNEFANFSMTESNIPVSTAFNTKNK